jgi:hypothetical protein
LNPTNVRNRPWVCEKIGVVMIPLMILRG